MRGGGGADAAAAGATNELTTLRYLIFCSVCSEKYKDTILTRCSHTFCRKCVDKCVQLRSRKCPTCGQAFAAEDVKPVYLS